MFHSKNYKLNRDEYQLVLPIDYEVIIPKDDSVRLLSSIIEGMDLSALYAAYSEQGKNPAVNPKNQFKIMVYAYMNGNYSTRKIESSCRRDINYMWLLSGEPAPDHSTISRFRKDRLSEIMEGLLCLGYNINKLHSKIQVNRCGQDLHKPKPKAA